MPQSYVNPFTPQTPIGAGLQNIASALFSGPTAADRQKSALDQAHAAYFQAQTDKLRQEALDKETARRDSAGALDRAAIGFFGNKPTADAYLFTRNTGMPINNLGFSGGGDANVGPLPAEQQPVATATPMQFDPNAVARYNRFASGVDAAKALPGNDNLAQLGKVIEALYANEVQQGALSGTLTGPQTQRIGAASAALAGKPLFNNLGEAGVFDQFGGQQQLNALGGAKINTERAHAGAYGAQAGASNAQADKSRAETRNLVAGLFGPSVDVQNPDGTVSPRFLGQAATDPNARTGAKPVAPKPATSTTTDVKPIKVTGKDREMLDAALMSAAGSKWSNEGDKAAVVVRQQEYFSTPGSPAYGKPDVAAKMAIEDVFGDSFSKEGMLSRAKGERRAEVPAVRLTAPTATTRTVNRGAPGQQPGAPAQQSQQPTTVARPAGKTDQQLIQEANAAVQRGADRNAVAERLRAWGVQVQ